ncbi:hypothetical protein ACP4OV_002199 [Aristida adscensionis]
MRGTSSAPSPMEEPAPDPFPIDDLTPIPLPQGPRIIHIDKDEVLATALATLALTVDENRMLHLNGTWICCIVISGLLNKETLKIEPKQFYGEFSESPALAIRSTHDAILNHLQRNKLIIVEDINYNAVIAAKKDLAAANSCSTLFQDMLLAQRKSVHETEIMHDNLVSAIEESLCAHLSHLPINANLFIVSC